MYDFQEILGREYWSNSVQDYLYALVLFVVLFLVFKAFQTIVVVRLKKLAESTDNDFDDQLAKIVGNISPLFYYVLALYFPVKSLSMSIAGDKVVEAVFIIVVVYQVIRSLQSLVEYVLAKFLTKKDMQGKQTSVAFYGMKIVVNLVLWVVGLLLVLSNLGFEINSLIASLGIGGIAVALALQNILGDIFSSFSIYFDKPFAIGDYIIVGEHSGTVKKIGLKTTRIQTLQGEELIISNNELTSTRVRNFKKMKSRRVCFNIGVIYSTGAVKLRKIEGLVKKVVDKVKLAKFDRCHFVEFGEFSLNFEIVFYVESPDYVKYLDIREKVNFAMKEEFDKAKIEMAFPTQTVYVKK